MTDPQDIVASAVDPWDATAQLESAGFSDRAAQVAGHASTHALARHLIDAQGLPGASVRTRVGWRWWLVRSALGRALVMVAGVIVCVSTMPRQSKEIVVFVVAATGWLAGQMVSAALWHALGRGSLGDAVRSTVATAGVAVVGGIVAAGVAREASVLIWVGWAISMPVLLTLHPGRRLVGAVTAAGLVCGGSWLSGPPALTVAIATAVTVGMVAVAARSVGKALRASEGSCVPGTVRAVGVALTQTAAQLAFLWVVFSRIGAGAFAAVAIAGLAAGVLADPLFALARGWGGWVSWRSSSWRTGRLLTAVPGPFVVAALTGAAVVAVWWVLQDPYRVFLDENLAVAAAVLAASTTTAVNALLRTGSAVGAMMFAVGVSMSGLVALIFHLPHEDPWQSSAFVAVMIATVTMAALVTTHRLSRPQAWSGG